MGSLSRQDSNNNGSSMDITASADITGHNFNGGNSSILNSWKEIARYLGRGVRTVQRWERDLSLSVHRPRGQDRSATLALRSELDEWLRKTPLRSRPDGHAGNGGAQNSPEDQ